MIAKTIKIFILFFIFCYLIDKFDYYRSYIRHIDYFTNNYLLSYIDSFNRQNKTNLEVMRSLLNSGQRDYNQVLAKICNSMIEEGTSPYELAEGYSCLAQIELKKKDEMSNFNAIRYFSFALASSNESKYIDNIKNSIIQGYEEEANRWIDINNNEIDYLTKLIKTNNISLRTRAMYRLSLIYQTMEHIDLKAVNMLQKQIMQQEKITRQKEVNIAFALNDDYLSYAKTTIATIILNSDLNTHYNFYFVMDPNDPISTKGQKELIKMSKLFRPFKIEFRNFPKNIIPENHFFNTYKNKLPIFKAFLENIFPEFDRMIVLDVDIFVQRDLYDLQNQEDFDRYTLAGALSAQKIGEPVCHFTFTYINGGVLVHNFSNMRKQNNTQNMLDKSNELVSIDKQCIAQLEQDTLNSQYSEQIKFVSKRWNYIPQYEVNTKLMPFIIHYAGTKPWDKKYKNSIPKHIQLYQHY